MPTSLPDWQEILKNDGLVVTCSKHLIDTANSHSGLTEKVLNNRLGKEKKLFKTRMFEMYLYKDLYTVVLDRTLKRNQLGFSQRDWWCITVGISASHDEHGALIYHQIRNLLKEQQNEDQKQLALVWIYGSALDPNSQVDQIFEAMQVDTDVKQELQDQEVAYAHYKKHLGDDEIIQFMKITIER
jgi:hypothetical protein